MAGAVSTVASNGEAGFADGAGAAARFDWPTDVVVDGEGVIVVADKNNHRLRKIVGGKVTTLAGSSESGTADGAGTVARFNQSFLLALGERGRLLVTELGRKDTLRVVEASLAPPLWMGPGEEAAQAAMRGAGSRVSPTCESASCASRSSSATKEPSTPRGRPNVRVASGSTGGRKTGRGAKRWPPPELSLLGLTSTSYSKRSGKVA
jgi:hypothetical protein